MAGEARHALDPVALEDALASEPWRFQFFEALRRIECAHAEAPRLGASRRAAEDPVRLAQVPSLSFAPSTIASYARGEGGSPGRLAVRFLGLFGPNGPLPIHMTEYVHDRVHNGHDPTIAHFADIFHHRVLSLFYRAWAAAAPATQYDRPAEDRYALYVGALFGLGQGSLRGRDALPDSARLHHAGHLSSRTRHPEGLRGMLADYFGMPVEIEEFIGHWVSLPSRLQCRLGESEATGRLGVTATLGERVWDSQGKFRIVFGPVGFADFQRMLPGSGSLERLVALVRGYVFDDFEWDVQVVLKRPDVPGVALGSQGYLGWTSWLLAGPAARDAPDYVIQPMAGRA